MTPSSSRPSDSGSPRCSGCSIRSTTPTIAVAALFSLVVALRVAVGGLAPLVVARPAATRRHAGGERGGGPLDHLVELAAVEPHTSTLGAEVDLHTLSGRDRQRHITHRALHGIRRYRPGYGTRTSGGVSALSAAAPSAARPGA